MLERTLKSCFFWVSDVAPPCLSSGCHAGSVGVMQKEEGQDHQLGNWGSGFAALDLSRS